ncbi:leucyl aminopeptidase [Streptoalloteichus tenebrarius]|uniref:Probable cytosol aminopeptidase n=1 Tax=Streptoalloteichus tenebrarius (strain ATCC 17920 / DSM 40477 / JCM 4838 / CBS 697.72 / NBRC 16177 / NCIMB 11028 / NRRL B-12390 / A12253. 1 / ISP 5477) TaxID=1933 RepID=A0ABT1I2D1_STRSD|nr:leucyl aminopeptidase [Streptoalloteichus tenebrarius]MCP2261881.1 leucyl aminopeptidase [Streptoalloteichus tenebrarius]BFF01056.1 M17 family metallopeptidase [Streptoalloteichus tenebrarius]
MPSPLPSVPTPLVDVQVTTAPRRGVPLAVVASPADETGSAPVLGPHADRLGLDAEWLELVGATGRAGQTHAVPAPDGSQGWLVGVGSGDARAWRSAGAALMRAVDGQAANEQREGRRPARAVQVALPESADTEAVAAFALGAMLGSHAFKVTNERTARTKELRLVPPAGADEAAVAEAVREASILARATGLARDLANTPSDVKDPAWLAGTAARLAEAAPGLTATVRDEAWLAENGFGGILAVGGGSVRPPRLLELSHRPRGSAKAPHLVLVGKGITFDTGGISIKPAEGMHLMRTDMSGGAAVIAALIAIAELNLPVRVTGLVPCAENHVSGSAYRPGDVVRHYGGTTTEVTNTDAEGRMVMADALAYAVRQLKPSLLVDVATLTGAMKVALGLRTGGLFATEDELAERINEAGRRTGEAWWRMPLLDDHAADVRSDIADVRQCPPGPGGITAALFLREFTGGLPWAHLDIAGPARADRVYDEVNPGGTGFAARTLVEFARSYC